MRKVDHCWSDSSLYRFVAAVHGIFGVVFAADASIDDSLEMKRGKQVSW